MDFDDEIDDMSVDHDEQGYDHDLEEGMDDLLYTDEYGESSLSDDDDTDKWLKATEAEKFKADADRMATRVHEGYKMSSVKALKQGQISHMPTNVQAAFVTALDGQLDISNAKMKQEDFDNGIGELGNVLGDTPSSILAGTGLRNADIQPGPVRDVSPEFFGVDNYNLGASQPVTYTREYQAAPSAETVNLVHGLNANSSDFFDRGAGGQLPGNITRVDGEADYDKRRRVRWENKRDDEMKQAVEYIQELAGLYIHEDTVGSNIEGDRQAAMETFLTKRFMNDHIFSGQAFLPLPNETGIYGLVPTRNAQDGNGTSPYNRREFSYLDSIEGEFRNDKERYSMMPNLKRSLFPLNGDLENPKLTQQYEMETATAKAEYAARVLREQMISNRDEDNGNTKRVPGFDTPYGDQSDSYDYRSEAMNFGLTYDELIVGVNNENKNIDITGSGQDSLRPVGSMLFSQSGVQAPKWEDALQGEMGPFTEDRLNGATVALGQMGVKYRERLKNAEFMADGLGYVDEQGFGSDRGGMYGNKNVSQMDLYVTAREMGMSEEEAYDQASGEVDIKWNQKFDAEEPVVLNDRNLYLAKVAGEKPYKQGGAQWLKQRRGKVTASQAGLLLTNKGQLRLADDTAREIYDPTGTKGMFKKWRGNAHTREGNDGERLARAAFLNSDDGEGLIVEDAFFEENARYRGMGASPDGRVFDKDGNNMGLLELKFLGSKSMSNPNKLLKKYTPQMQMQMLVTNETQTRFFALDKHTGETFSEMVYADPQMQKSLLAGAAIVNRHVSGAQDYDGVKALSKRRRLAKNRAGPSSSGREAAWEPVGQEDERFVAYSPEEEAYLFEDAKEAVSEYRGNVGEQPGDQMSAEFHMRTADKADYDRNKDRVVDLEQAHKQAMSIHKQRIAAEREAAESARTFSNSLKNASKAGDLVDDMFKVFRDATASAMSTVQMAGKVGTTANLVRGAEKGLFAGGVAAGDVNSVIMGFGNIQSQMNDPQTGAQYFAKVKQKLMQGAVELPEIREFADSVTHEQMRGMKTIQGIQWLADNMTDMGEQERQYVANVFDSNALTGYRARTDVDTRIYNPEAYVNADGARAVRAGEALTKFMYKQGSEATLLEGEAGVTQGAGTALNELMNSFNSTSGAAAKLAAAALTAGAALGAMVPESWTTKFGDLFFDNDPIGIDPVIAPRTRRSIRDGKTDVSVKVEVTSNDNGTVTSKATASVANPDGTLAADMDNTTSPTGAGGT